MTRTKKIITIVAAVIVVAIIAAIGFASVRSGVAGQIITADAAWEGDGAGTSDNPYRIGSRAQMEKFRDIVNGSNGESRNISACAVLTADFDLEGDDDHQWTPIADSDSNKYTGTFDGNGHTISGLYINDVSAVNVGLFGYTGSGSVIKDLTVAGKIICCNGAVFVKENNGSILRCTNNADIDAQEEVGGIAQQNNGNITDCVNAGAVYSRFAISSCSSGGIVSRNAGTVTGCVNNGVIKLFSVYGEPSSTGGIIGTNSKIVSYCVNNGTVAMVYGEYGGSSNYVGGVVGNQWQEGVTRAKTTYCVNNGLVTYEGGNGNCFSGGVVGNITHGSTVENCYNVGKVQVPSSGRAYGVVYHSSNDNTIINCYNIGQVSGGLKGQITWESGAENCYYLANQTGEMTNGQRALSQSAFADAANFSNWDFSGVWTMYQEENGFMRPYLAKARVNYYSKDNAATGYSQLCTLWGVDDVLSELHEPADFGADYENLYSVAGATHDGWTTEIGGEKVYDFGGTYTGKDALTLYPHYTINAPTSVTTEGYVAEYDGASHNISITVTHELAGATITYQWYLREALNPAFALITGATGSTYSVKNGGDSGLYKVTYRISLPGHGEYKAYEAEENAIYVNITAGEDPTTFPEQMTATIGQTLADVALPDGWEWIDTTTALNTIGSFWFEAKYNNDDAFVYQANVIVNHGAWTGRGTGTADDPYIIKNKEQLEFFRDIVNGKFGATKNNKACARLVANINLAGSDNDQWSPFVLYTGVFDGNGYTIKGVYINKPSSDNAFFMEIALGGIKNLTLEGYVACFDGGGFVETVREGVVISNCHNKVTVIGDKTNDPYNLAVGARTGGIAAYNYGTIEDCTNNADVQSFRPGGIVGENYGTIRRCENNYSLTAVSYNGGGGIAGAMQGAAVIEYCINRGDLFDPTKTFSCLGGICGTAKESGDNLPIIRYCVNEGKISGQTSNGGILGIAKNNNIVIRDCYNLADVVGTSYCAGICGVGGAVYNSYNMGSYPGTTQGHHFGPICGDSTRIYNCYYLDDQTGEMTDGQKALSLADFADEANFVDWDFEKVWTIKDGRPQLYRDFVIYCDKNGEVTSYAQPRTILGCDDILPNTTLKNADSFGADYATLYGANGPSHDGWAKEFGGTKSYSFGAIYSASKTVYLYPCYSSIDVPTVTAEGYTATYDSAAHDLTATVEHDLGTDATYTYQWYKLNAGTSEYEPIEGATSATYAVTDVADSGTYKVVATLHFAGYTVDGQKTDIVVTIGKADPTAPIGLEATYGDTLANVDLPDSWSWVDDTTSVGTVGERTFKANYAETDNYNAASNVDVTVTVVKADPDVPTGLTSTIGNTLASVILPEGWAWVDGTTIISKVGPCSYAATYTPADAANYNAKAIDLTVDVYHAAWDGEGTGTESDPYVITNKAQLEHFRDIVNGDYVETENEYACAVLANDIDLNGNDEDQWIPIGNKWEDGNNVFRGIFDGNNKTIRGLYIKADENDYESKGLFGKTYRATIKDLTVYGSVTCRNGAGIVASPTGTLVLNCVNYANVTAYQSAGGVAGFCITAAGKTGYYTWRDTQIINCVNNGDITGFYRAGGIAYHNEGDIYGCVNNGDILIERNQDQSNDSALAGGIAARSSDTIAYCVNNGSVTVILNYPYYSAVSAGVGGICASHWVNDQPYRAGRKILSCVNNGEVLCQHTSAYNNHEKSNAGGITGFNNCVVENCYNTANVTGTDYVGGICGKSGGEDQDAGWITNCYNLGTVTKKNNAAGAQIMDDGNAIVTKCRYLADTTDLNAGALAQADFATEANFEGWDFDKVWTMYQEENDFSRPHLFGGDVRYYNKDGWSIAYTQPKSILCIDGILPGAVTLFTPASFGADYGTLYNKDGYVHYGWATEFGGEKVYDFGEEYTGESDLELYPVYAAILTGLTATIGDTLSSVILPEGWAWVDGTTVISKVGPCSFAATYNGAATELEVIVYHAEWDGEGTGTESDPYVITTKAQLEHFRDIVNGYYVETKNEYACAVLANDIDLNGSASDQWSPIGDFGAYQGIFDGNNKTISGLYIDNDKNHMGLFGEVYNGTVKDLTVAGTVTCNYGAGIASLVSGSTIINCVNNVDVTATVSAGGIAYFTVGIPSREPLLINCVNNGDITSGAYMCGGIVANSNYTVIGCVNNGDIRLTYTSVLDSFVVGGIAGDNSGEILYCVNNGNVFATVDHNSVNVYVGGIAGDNSGKILYCVNNGEINCSCSGAYIRDGAGGIAGWSQAIIENCYNTGNVTGYAYAGGINGKGSTDQSSATIKNCYNMGIIKIVNNADGEQILGSGSITVTGCHYLAAESNAETGALSAADFANAVSFAGWDFENVWTMRADTARSMTRPYLFGGDIRYYNKNGRSIAYAQPKTILDVDGILPDAVTLFTPASFGAEYDSLYNKDGYVQNGWATEKGGEKVYNFGEEYTGESDLELYPSYVALTGTVGEALSSVILPEGWAWVDGTTIMSTVGPCSFAATYNEVEVDLNVTVYHVAWDGEGTGTESDPYVITNKAQLEHFRDIVNGFCVQTQNINACAVLANDINLNGSESDQWIPIGGEFVDTTIFRGTFDGAGYTISGLYINNNKTYMGLFGTIGNGGLVKDLTVEGTVTANWGAGIAGFIIDGGRIVDCVNKANVTGKYAAGIAMYVEGEVIDCENRGTMTATQMAGGIAVSNDGIITDCVNKGQIQILNDATEDATICVGGIAAHNTRTISDCINNGKVFVSLEYPTPNVSINVNAGGIAGRNFDSVTYCVNNAEVEVQVNWGGKNEYAYVGGIVGSQRRQSDNERYRYEVRYCANDGDVSNCYGYTSDNVRHDYTGGIVGRFDYGVIADCYSTGYIHGGTCCGGICCTTDGSTEGTIINCYNTGIYEKGTLSAGNPIVANGNPTVISCYYRIFSQTTSEDPNAYYDGDLAVQSNFEGWDFGKVWTMYTRYSTARPYLVREGIVYYDKNGEATNYGQARVILDVNDTMPAVNLFDIASFGDDYNALYVKPGYVLDGWATTAGGEKVYDFGDEYAAAEGIVLYPHYTLVTYTITYENWPAVNEGVTNDNPTTYTVEDGDIVLVAPNREGYEFVGWVIGDEDPVEDYTIISGTTGDITLTIEWLMMIDDPYGFAAPTVTALNGYVGAYDGKAHAISATIEHELEITYTYRWKKDGVIIEGATSATLSVKDVADSGVYTLLYTASFNGRAREEAEAGPIVVYIGQKSVRLDIEDKTSVEGYVTDATATVKGAVEGERIDVIVTYRKGTTVLTEKPTRPGQYIAVATIDEANYVAEPVEAAFVINVAEIDPNNVENTTGKDITVSSPDGFGEDTTLTITNPDSDKDKSDMASKIGEDKNVVEVYHIDMKEDGKDVELTDPVKVRLPIPDDLKNKGFDVYNVNGDHVEKVKYKIDGDFIEFETDTLGNFAFVERTEVNKDGEDGGNVVTQKISSLIDKIGLDVFIYILIGAVFLDIILLIALAVAILRRL